MASKNNQDHPKEEIKSNNPSPKRYIIEYYDSLINHIDIRAEEVLAQHDTQKQIDLKDARLFSRHVLKWPNDEIRFPELLQNRTSDLFDEKYQEPIEIKSYNKSYHTTDRASRFDERTSVGVHEYVNEMRQEMIDELTKVQDETLKNYATSVRNGIEAADCNFNRDNKEELARYKKKVFGEKFAFLIYSIALKPPSRNLNTVANPSPFNVYLVVLDDFHLDDQTKTILK